MVWLLTGCGALPYYPQPLVGDDTSPKGESTPIDDSATDTWPRDASGAYCSSSSAVTPATVVVDNRRAEDLALYWVDSACQSTYYQTVPQGQSIAQSSYIDHGWAVRRPATSELVHTFLVQQDGQVEVVK